MTRIQERAARTPGALRAWVRDRLLHAPPTRMLPVRLLIAGRPRQVWLKMEGDNRWGSIKDRTALNLVDSVADRLAGPDPVLVESTSGNLGVALASIARETGLRFVAVVDPKLSARVARRLTDLGAELDHVTGEHPPGSYLPVRLARVRELCQRMPDAVWPNQYGNQANPRAHYRTTGPEIVTQTDGAVDAVFVAVSTGGTVTGIGQYLREVRPDARVIAVDVAGSTALRGRPAHRVLTGIGAGCRSNFARPELYDEVVIVQDASAIAFCRELRAATGLHVGGSSGAVLAASAAYLSAHPEIRHPVCVCADGGGNYADSLYDDEWLSQHGITLSRQLLRPGDDLPPVTFERA